MLTSRSSLLIASENLFLNLSDAGETAICSFSCITHISTKKSRLVNKAVEIKSPHHALCHALQ